MIVHVYHNNTGVELGVVELSQSALLLLGLEEGEIEVDGVTYTVVTSTYERDDDGDSRGMVWVRK